MTAISVGLSAASSAAGFAGQQSQTNSYNAAAKQNAINASVAATHQYEDEGRRLISDAKQTNNEGYQAIMKARQAKGTVMASAGTSGMDAGSLSVDSILAGISSDEANSGYAVASRHDDGEANYRSAGRGIEAQAQGRINSMPFKDGPSPLGMALSIGTDALGSISKSPTGKKWLGIE